MHSMESSIGSRDSFPSLWRAANALSILTWDQSLTLSGAIKSLMDTRLVKLSLNSHWIYQTTCSSALVRDYFLKIRWTLLTESWSQENQADWHHQLLKNHSQMFQRILHTSFLSWPTCFMYCNLQAQARKLICQLHSPLILSMYWREMGLELEKLMKKFSSQLSVKRVNICMLKVFLRLFGLLLMLSSLKMLLSGQLSRSSYWLRISLPFSLRTRDGLHNTILLTVTQSTSSSLSWVNSLTNFSSKVKF